MLFIDKAKAKASKAVDQTIKEPIRNIGVLAIFATILASIAIFIAVVRK
jgi:hypothetical protein